MTILKYQFQPSELNSIQRVVNCLKNTPFNCSVDHRKESPTLIITYKGRFTNDEILFLGVRIGEIIYASKSLNTAFHVEKLVDNLLSDFKSF